VLTIVIVVPIVAITVYTWSALHYTYSAASARASSKRFQRLDL
jgi:hypothetical protein